MLPTILWETGLEQSPFISSAGVSVVIMPYKCAVCQEINREQAVLVAAVGQSQLMVSWPVTSVEIIDGSTGCWN